jgi:hypothetical protein
MKNGKQKIETYEQFEEYLKKHYPSANNRSGVYDTLGRMSHNILMYIVLRWGGGENPHTQKTSVANVQAHFKLSSNVTRHYLELLAANRFLKKESYPGYATLYYPN